jgi:long-chain-alcohol oxidase
VAELLIKRFKKDARILVRVILSLLATRLGTFMLCGFLCKSRDSPFIRKFSDLPLERREIVLRKWSRETRCIPLRMFFVVIKILSQYIFYSMVNDFFSCPYA